MKKSSQLSSIKAFILTTSGIVLLYGPFAFAASAGKDTLQGYLILIGQFLNSVIIPLVFSIAFLFFLINIARFFILKGAESEAREQARTFAFYGIITFVILISIWGIVNAIIFAFGLNDGRVICPDYLHDSCPKSGYDYYGPGSDEYFYTP